jgi:hypothetical protein
VQLGVSAEASVKVQSGLLHAFQARVHAAWMDRERLRRDIEAGL